MTFQHQDEENQAISGQGRIFQINVSQGGVPKLAVRAAEVNSLGVAGDRQRDLEFHGGPQRAVCLYPLENILALQAEGHPIFPGAQGENLTLSGIDWNLCTPGARLQIGGEVLLEVTTYTTPCSNLKPFFLNQDFSRVAQKLHPGWSRLYSRVLRPGMIQVGDPVILFT